LIHFGCHAVCCLIPGEFQGSRHHITNFETAPDRGKSSEISWIEEEAKEAFQEATGIAAHIGRPGLTVEEVSNGPRSQEVFQTGETLY